MGKTPLQAVFFCPEILIERSLSPTITSRLQEQTKQDYIITSQRKESTAESNTHTELNPRMKPKK